jgi:hypothetical protein
MGVQSIAFLRQADEMANFGKNGTMSLFENQEILRDPAHPTKYSRGKRQP